MEVHAGPQTEQLRERARAVVPGGVHSNVRLVVADYFFSGGAGAWLWDVDGRDYVDYCLGQGPMLFGHANAAIDGAVAMACTRGMVFGAQHPLEVEASEKIIEMLGWADRVRLTMSGTEAVHAVIRIARAATGRTKIVRFEGHYHGWADNIFIPLDGRAVPASRGQPAEMFDNLLVMRWNDAEAVEQLLEERGKEIACVIMEPIMFNRGAVQPHPGYLERVRTACSRHGVVLIFDEVITGFRLGPGGAVQHLGVRPDLATFGKAIAGGWPVAAFAGRADLMDPLADDVNHSGTFNGSVMASAAVVATLTLLREKPPYEDIKEYGSTLMRDLEELGDQHGLPLRINGLPAAFNVAVAAESFGSGEDDGSSASLALHGALAKAGIWSTTRGIWFVSAAHGQREHDATLDRAGKAFDLVASQARAKVPV